MPAGLPSLTYAKMRSLSPGDVSLNGGFWGQKQAVNTEQTVPGIWASLSNPEVSPGWQNFQIAARELTGVHQGPPFMDGDFYKWFESASATLRRTQDPQLREKLAGIRDVIASVQRDDGYLHTATLIDAINQGNESELADRFNFETYNLGHLISAMIRHYEASGDQKSIRIATRAADYLETLATDDPDTLAESAICPSHYMAVVELYRATGDERYIRLSRRFLDVRGRFKGGDDNQDRIPVSQQTEVVGHSVRANYLYAGLADMLLEEPDTDLQATLTGLWDEVTASKIYITGGCGALYDGASPDGFPEQTEITRVHQAYGRPYQLPQTTAHNETCANIGMMLWSERMLLLTGDPKYADLYERIAYNSFLSGISLDGTRFSYTNPLRQVRDLPYPLRMPGDTAIDPVPTPPPSDDRARTEYLSVFCCPPNVSRTLAHIDERVASRTDSALFINQYTSADVTAEFGGETLELQINTDYPWDESIRFTVLTAPNTPVTLALRVPSWATDATLTADGETRDVAPGYAELTKTWTEGEQLELTLPLHVKKIRTHRLAEESTNQIAIMRGPLVYCLESTDLPEGVVLEQAAVQRNSSFRPEPIEIDGNQMTGLVGTGTVLPAAPNDDLYADVDTAPLTDAELHLVPYFAWGNRGPSEMSVFLPLIW